MIFVSITVSFTWPLQWALPWWEEADRDTQSNTLVEFFWKIWCGKWRAFCWRNFSFYPEGYKKGEVGISFMFQAKAKENNVVRLFCVIAKMNGRNICKKNHFKGSTRSKEKEGRGDVHDFFFTKNFAHKVPWFPLHIFCLPWAITLYFEFFL